MGIPPLQEDPAGHAAHEVAPEPLNVPGGHGWQLGASATLLEVPAVQGKQDVILVLGSVVFALPA